MPSIPTQLGLPAAPETIAYRAVERILKSDPTLNRAVRCWTSWKGDPGDGIAPTPAACPHVALSPMPGPTGWETEEQHNASLYFRIEPAVAGTNADELLNLWHAIRQALFPPDVDSERFAWVRRQALDARIVKPTLILSGYGAATDPDGGRMLFGRGVLKVLLHVQT